MTPGPEANTLKRHGFLGPESALTCAIVAFDWSATPLGAIDEWTPELRTATGLMMGSDYAGALWWGPELWLVHNEAYQRDLLRERGACFGRRFDDVWSEVVAAVRPDLDTVLTSGRGKSWIEKRVDLIRNGKPTETYWNYSFTPVLGVDGRVLGILDGSREMTDTVLRNRSDALMIALDEQLLAAKSVDAMIAAVLALIGEKLGARRTGFAEVDQDAATLAIHPCWTTGAMTDLAGRYPLGMFGRISGDLAAGRVVVIEDNLTDPRTSDIQTVDIYARIKLRAGMVVPILDRGRYVGGVFVQDDVPRRWQQHEIELATAAAARLWDAVVRLRAETSRRASEARYRLIFEQADDIIFTADIDQRITDCNAAGAEAMGLPREAIIGRSIADFVSPVDFEQTSSMLQHKIDHGGNTRHEVSVVGRDGKKMRWENNSTLVIDRDNRPIGLLSISRDVTERRAFDERRELLIHELNHRVKNTLALVQALAQQSFRHEADNSAATGFIARLRTLAAAHDLLTREHWEGVTLAELVRAATAPLGAHRVAAGGAAVTVTPKAAVALAMAIHELGTNAVKYGALSNEDGRVDVVWTAEPTGLALEWRERGGPLVTVPKQRGFGVRMIERVLASDIGGSVTMDFAEDGLRCRVKAPLAGNVI